MASQIFVTALLVLMAYVHGRGATQGLLTGQIRFGRKHSTSNNIYDRETSPLGFWLGVCYCYVATAVLLAIAIYVGYAGLPQIKASSQTAPASQPMQHQDGINIPCWVVLVAAALIGTTVWYFRRRRG